MYRRTALVIALMTAVLAGPHATAADRDKRTLDGQKSTEHSYTGTLAGPTVYAGMTQDSVSLSPQPSWCNASTCDTTMLLLRLPSGRQSGRLVVELTRVSPTASMHFVVYDDEDQPLPGQSTCCSAYRFVSTRMPAGDYKVVVYADAGRGEFEVAVSWLANPRHRSSSSGTSQG